MRWFSRGDIDGFFGLAIDNLVQVLLIVALCQGVLGFPAELIFGRMLPAIAVSLIVGNLFYSWQAIRLANRTGQADVCALPYGINTVSLFAYVFLVMLPAKLAAEEAKLPPDEVTKLAWQAGLVACVGSGVIEFLGAFVAPWLRSVTPRAALLATLSGIAIGFIAMPFVFQAAARPVIGLVTLGIILLTYFGKVQFRGGLPGGFVAVAIGTALAWGFGYAPNSAATLTPPQWTPPVPVLGDLVAALTSPQAWVYVSVIIPMGLFNLIGSLQNIESAEAAGDAYPTAPSLAVNGLGTVAAACFGSPFPTTIYIGHPGWKGMGARAGYSVLNAVFFTIICLGGMLGAIQWAVPLDAGLAIVLYIGIVITAQAFQATPREHAPAVVLGLIPSIAAWGTLLAKQAYRVGSGGKPLTPEVAETFVQREGVWIDGAFALSEGFILSAMIWAAIGAAIIDRRFRAGAIWCFGAAALSAVGMMHSFRYNGPDTVMSLGVPAWEWVKGYAAFGVLLLAAPFGVRSREVPTKDGHLDRTREDVSGGTE